MSIQPIRWLRRAYPKGEREPLFVPLYTYLLAVTILGLVLGFQWFVAFDYRKPYWELTSVTLVTNYIWAGIGLLVWEMAQIFPLERKSLLRDVLAFALAGAALLWLQQTRFYFLGGYGNPGSDLSYLDNARYFLANEAIFYLVMYLALVFVVRGWYAHARMQRLRLRSAELEEELARTRLQHLRAQLHPHFFFNALNTISAFLHEDPAKADQAIELLSRLMRRALQQGEGETTSLAEELAAAREYLQLQQMRFRARLRYEVQAGDPTLQASVPAQILQPIIENCISHGVESSSEPTQVTIRSAHEAGQLVITVRNSVNSPSAHNGFGHGLASVERRLQLLYGARAGISAQLQGGEFHVRIALPWTPEPVRQPVVQR